MVSYVADMSEGFVYQPISEWEQAHTALGMALELADLLKDEYDEDWWDESTDDNPAVADWLRQSVVEELYGV